jgi:Fe-S-cluster containining protein
MTNASTELTATFLTVDGWCDAARSAIDIGCEAGCSACCTILVSVTLPEAMALLENKQGRAAFDRHRDAIEESARLFFERHPSTKVKPWAARKQACPFLEHDRCSVYRSRPINCRTHLAIAKCRPFQDGNGYVDAREIQHVGYRLAVNAAARIGVPFVVGPMHPLLVIADEIVARGLDAASKRFGDDMLSPLKAAVFWGWCES